MVSLKMTDIDFDKNVIKLYNSKTKSYNEFPLYDQLKNFIKKNVPKDGYNGYLLPYRHRGGIHKVFYTLRHNLGMKDPNTYNLHTFRKYFITKLLERGLPIFDVSKLAHHKNIKTTMRYYAKVETGKLCDKLNELMPIVKKKKPKAA
jgi:integrase